VVCFCLQATVAKALWGKRKTKPEKPKLPQQMASKKVLLCGLVHLNCISVAVIAIMTDRLSDILIALVHWPFGVATLFEGRLALDGLLRRRTKAEPIEDKIIVHAL